MGGYPPVYFKKNFRLSSLHATIMVKKFRARLRRAHFLVWQKKKSEIPPWKS